MPHQVPGATTSLWSPPVPSYTAMASPTETIASTSTASRAVGTSSMPPLEALETSPPLSMASLLLTAGVGRGAGGRTPPRAPTAPGPRQSRPRAPQTPPPSRALPHLPLGARVGRGWLVKPDLEEGRRLEVPMADNEPLDPPPKDQACGDQASATGQLQTTISRTRCRTM